jgi:MFS family permease
LSYPKLLLKALALGFQDVDIGLAYIGGFVARASSVAISLFIPLFVNFHFISSGECPANPEDSILDPGQIKKNCQRAYIVSSILTGVSQLVALLCAPLFGYLTARFRRINLPLLIGACAGVAGYISFGFVKTPDPHSRAGYIELYFIVILIGVSQISAIVCSLGILSRGIQRETEATSLTGSTENETEAEPLLSSENQSHSRTNGEEVSRAELKGSIAGVYSFAGGAGILLLTKVGGLLFDKTDPGSPFFIMAGFNALLMVVGAICAMMNDIQYENMHISILDRHEGSENSEI